MKCSNHATWAFGTGLILMSLSAHNMFQMPIYNYQVYTPVLPIIGAISAYALDIDTKASEARQFVMKLLGAFSLAVVVPNLTLAAVSRNNSGEHGYAIMPLIVVTSIAFFIARLKHRRETHSLVIEAIALIITLAMAGIFSQINNIMITMIYGIYLGFLVHVFTDCFTPRGVAIFWPIIKYKFHLPIRLKDDKAQQVATNTFIWTSSMLSIGIYLFQLSVLLRG